MDYYFFVDDDKIGKIIQVIDKVDRSDDQSMINYIGRSLTIVFDDKAINVEKFFSVGQALVEENDQIDSVLTVADENKENIIYQTEMFNYLDFVESVIDQDGSKDYRYVWKKM